MRTPILIALILACTLLTTSWLVWQDQEPDTPIVSHIVDPKQKQLRMYWRNPQGKHYHSIGNLKNWLEKTGKELTFAMNGGMYLKDRLPQGLYIEEGVVITELNEVDEAYGNFYMQPNGVFYISQEDRAGVCVRDSTPPDSTLKYATQSGPMLLIDGKLHPRFIKGSNNLHIRNGVGILPDGKVLFAMSLQRINFYDFASWFREKGCKQALYLDGFVSRTYLPDKGQTDLGGKFGVIIGESRELPSRSTDQ